LNLNFYGQTWSLEQCIDSACSNNNRIAIAENNQDIYALKQKEAQANRLPKLSLNGEYKYFIELPYQLMPLSVFGGPEGQFKEAQFGVPHNINASLLLQAPIYSNTLTGNIRKMETSQKIIEIEVQKTYEQLYFEVANIYRNAQLLTSQMIFIDSTITNTNSVLKNIQLLVTEKLANQNDVKKLELKVSTLTLYYSNLESKLEQIYNALQFLTGASEKFKVERDIIMTDIKNYQTKWSKELDIILLQQEFINIDLETLKKSKFVPEVGFVATYGIQGLGYDQSPNQFLNFYPIGYAGIRFSYPIFNGNITNKKIDQKSLELKNLQLKEELIADAQKVEITNTLLQIENAYENVELNEKQIQIAQAIYAQEVQKHKSGLLSINDLLIAQNEVIQNQQNYLQSIADFLSIDLELKRITNNISNNQ
jgi:OMF family outer membrane factor